MRVGSCMHVKCVRGWGERCVEVWRGEGVKCVMDQCVCEVGGLKDFWYM